VGHSQPSLNPTGGDALRRGATQPALHDDLMVRVVDRANLQRAWKRVKANRGAPGSDGIPTVADRIAQAGVKAYLEPELEEHFHPDSYGYRPKKSALDAVGVARERCWRDAGVLDLDIRAYFDTIPHDLLVRAVKRHTDCAWVLLYVERWLKAPVQHDNGTLESREKGTPKGSVISPLLANLFLHYVFDRWLCQPAPPASFPPRM
jgi:RNA-directed DNA polymerase